MRSIIFQDFNLNINLLITIVQSYTLHHPETIHTVKSESKSVYVMTNPLSEPLAKEGESLHVAGSILLDTTQKMSFFMCVCV